jgi:TolB protein
MKDIPEKDPGNSVPEKPERWRKLDRAIAGLFAASLLISLVLLGWPMIQQQFGQVFAGRALGAGANSASLTTSPTPTKSPSPTITPTPTATAVPLPLGVSGNSLVDHSFVFSMTEAGYAHLFIYSLKTQRFQRLTDGAWDDVQPVLSADGRRLAYASRQNGAWDIYIMDLETGEVAPLTEDLAYDGAPSWSPDGGWLAYENYANGKLEIFMQPRDGSLDPIQISTNGGLYFSPTWSPIAQQVAVFADREFAQELWIIDLEESGEQRFRFVAEGERLGSATWSPDGERLAWSAWEDGQWRIYAQVLSSGERSLIGVGEQPVWGPDGQFVLAVLGEAQTQYLTAYTLEGKLVLAPLALPGQVDGLAWVGAHLDELPVALQQIAEATLEADWQVSGLDGGGARASILPLDGVDAPQAGLNELAIPAFTALRQAAAGALGWDLLSHLDDAIWPVSQAPAPARERDWLYTGRAFNLDQELQPAGWMQVVKEEINGEVYWRVFLRTAAQDGSQGQPMTMRPWDLNARVSGGEIEFQNGGRLADSVPAGYWVDFTALAQRYGWERLPALSNWRSYYPGALLGEFVLRDGLTWGEAMLQLYTPEQLSGEPAP